MKPGVAPACKPHPGEVEAALSREFEAGLTYVRTCQGKEGEIETQEEKEQKSKKKIKVSSAWLCAMLQLCPAAGTGCRGVHLDKGYVQLSQQSERVMA